MVRKVYFPDERRAGTARPTWPKCVGRDVPGAPPVESVILCKSLFAPVESSDVLDQPEESRAFGTPGRGQGGRALARGAGNILPISLRSGAALQAHTGQGIPGKDDRGVSFGSGTASDG